MCVQHTRSLAQLDWSVHCLPGGTQRCVVLHLHGPVMQTARTWMLLTHACMLWCCYAVDFLWLPVFHQSAISFPGHPVVMQLGEGSGAGPLHAERSCCVASLCTLRDAPVCIADVDCSWWEVAGQRSYPCKQLQPAWVLLGRAGGWVGHTPVSVWSACVDAVLVRLVQLAAAIHSAACAAL